MELKPFEDTYLLKGVTQNFVTGHRSNLRFAIDSLSLGFTNLNAKGPEPFEYLEFAKSDILQGGTKGAINALGNAKRAIHLTIQNILHAWGLLPAFQDQNFPTQIAVLRELNAFPTRTLEALNRKRNFVEHEFASADFAEVADLVDIAEMFLLIAYPYLRMRLSERLLACLMMTNATNGGYLQTMATSFHISLQMHNLLTRTWVVSITLSASTSMMSLRIKQYR